MAGPIWLPWSFGNSTIFAQRPLKMSSLLLTQYWHTNVNTTHILTMTFFCYPRPPRTLDVYAKYKATEFRQFLLYTRPVALHGILSNDLYEHFVLFHGSLRILASVEPSREQLFYAKMALRTFVQQSESLYGQWFVSYNVHGLLHLVKDVELLGPVDTYSAFPYENNIRVFKRYCRKPNLQLQQIANRRAERARQTGLLLHNKFEETMVRNMHNTGPLPDDAIGIELIQYRCLRTQNFTLNFKRNGNCCILKNSIIFIIVNIFVRQSKHYLVEKSSIVLKPCMTWLYLRLQLAITSVLSFSRHCLYLSWRLFWINATLASSSSGWTW